MSTNPCEATKIEYAGNGSRTKFQFPFTYMHFYDVKAALWDETAKEYVEQTNLYVLSDASTLEFLTAPPPPADGTPNGLNIRIYRDTDLDDMEATFYPGSSIRAQDLNDDFDQVRFAIQETQCSVESNSSDLGEKFWGKFGIGGRGDLGEPEPPYDTVYEDDQVKGRWYGDSDGGYDDQEAVPTTGAISARLDPYVQSALPDTRTAETAGVENTYNEQTGKRWINKDDCWESYWDPDAKAWVAYVNTGPRGLQGPPGEQGPDGLPGPGLTIKGVMAAGEWVEPVPKQAGDVWIAGGEITGFPGGGTPQDNDALVFNGDNWINIGPIAIEGPQGPTGETLFEETPDKDALTPKEDLSLQTGGNPVNGTQTGTFSNKVGVYVASRETGNNVWIGYLTGNSSATSFITSDGNASFDGKIQADSGEFDGKVEAKGGIQFGDGTTLTTATSNYSLPTASASVLGGIKVGDNLTIDANGKLSAEVYEFDYDDITLKGVGDFTSTMPSGSVLGDLYLNSTTGTGAWTGFIGEDVKATDRALFDGSEWKLISVTVEAPDLQSVTDTGNTTTNDIEVGSITAAGTITAAGSLEVGSGDQGNTKLLSVRSTASSNAGRTAIELTASVAGVETPVFEVKGDGGITAAGTTTIGPFAVGDTAGSGHQLVPGGLQYVQRPGTSPNEAVYSVYKGTDNTITFDCGGNAKFDGSVAIGGNDAAHTMDEYEEGTWTPNVGGDTTYINQTGSYTKIGRVVIAKFEIDINVLGTGSSQRIENLPFNAPEPTCELPGSVIYFSNLATNVASIMPYAGAGTSRLWFNYIIPGGANIAGVNAAIFQDGTRISGAVTYFTDP